MATKQAVETKKKHIFWRFILPSLLVIGAFAAYFFIDFTKLSDRFAGMSFSPTPEMTQLMTDLSLTDKAAIITKASHPMLQTRQEFNESCASYNIEIAVLGCYVKGRIFIYDINHPGLEGIRQSTLAHEVLHAAWDRLSFDEQNRLSPALEMVYNEHLDTLGPRLEKYPAANRLDELHSIIGTEINVFPIDPHYADILSRHYDRYFQNRAKVVAYYLQYADMFAELRAEADRLDTEIADYKRRIDEYTDQYQADASALNARIRRFNECADIHGCYTPSTFEAERRAIIAEQNRLNNLYAEIARLVEECNVLVDQYNANASHANELSRSMNSNSPLDGI
jgi:hypothetical protein